MRCAFIEIMATVIDVLWDYSFSRVGGGSCDFQKCGFSPFSDTVHSKLLIFFHRDDQS